MPDRMKIATRVISRAPAWMVEAVAWGLVVILPALLWYCSSKITEAENAKGENRVLHEQVEDLRQTLRDVVTADHYGVPQ